MNDTFDAEDVRCVVKGSVIMVDIWDRGYAYLTPEQATDLAEWLIHQVSAITSDHGEGEVE